MTSKNKKDTLKVNKGIEIPNSTNKNAIEKFRQKKKSLLTIDEYVNGILDSNISILSRAITLIESSLSQHQEIAQEIITKCLPFSGKSIRIGITGVPGVGKSTFIEALGKYLTSNKHKLAVLAVDPSSKRSGGSILGDKTRMEELSVDNNAFIRPSPSSGTLGGVARKSRETILLCEAAGFDVVFVETVGVGQSETAVQSMVDFFLLLMLSGAGDELQGIKRGIMEMADAIAITKSDGDNKKKAEIAKNEYRNALHMFPLNKSAWSPPVSTCSSMTKEGIDKVWKNIIKYFEFTKKNNYFEKKRIEQSKYWMYETIDENLKANFYGDSTIKEEIKKFEIEVLKGNISSFNAANILLNKYFSTKI